MIFGYSSNIYIYIYIQYFRIYFIKYALIAALVRRSMSKSTLIVVGILAAVAIILSALSTVPMQETIAQDTTFDFKQDQENKIWRSVECSNEDTITFS
jgi:hypothetical protein